ncbi:cobalamin biosynthesis protein CobW [Marchantia polymorpha subsp. ruderalis]|uniref:CobW C-terminal domain-containing protein n=2 Tax=Marchantia polymorpha TaxID=3197 RepID=A0A176VT33_MARPO|nr:hypothetical protein AXG93_620s1220 [Marchantia polymorpha subsp. ruderalis]PTQ48366.1 hypothetical protein MARPO_0005s0038 [Marchantia polymorpha]BBM97437.1 hypothetical protein Mp_1g05690 [Marchantia polymorpha subsp. ruderalis]|eukprot:PTQ48366.1 hypothetical protein MARPO_0005s0038 [Marchantia polymorpha]
MAMAAAACCGQRACASLVAGVATNGSVLSRKAERVYSCPSVSSTRLKNAAVKQLQVVMCNLGTSNSKLKSLPEKTFAIEALPFRSVAQQTRGRNLSTIYAAAGAAQQAELDDGLVREATVEVVEDSGSADDRVPVTVITGFLGSGKTTLVNHILTGKHGKRIAVIENEFGEVDIDGSLVAAQKSGAEDIVMLNNGCLCCTVRGDLVRMLSELVRTKKDKFDHILVETTGLANPLPIIQTFFLEEQLSVQVRLDGVVTLVDAKHATRHIEEVKPEGVVNEAVEQIAYADRIILNKTDLVSESDIEALMRQIKRINALATVQRATYGTVDMDYVIGVGGYELEKVEDEVKAESETHDHSHHDHEHHDHDHHEHHHGEDHNHGHEHGPDCAPDCGHDHADGHIHDHVHDPGVSSVSIVCGGNLDIDKINTWLEDLLDQNSDNIYRMKGVLSIEGFDSRFVFQGVHALFEGSPDRAWGTHEERTNKIVFIGRELDRASLEKGFKDCLV